MILRAIVVDDEELARDRLKSLLKAIPDVEVIGEAGNGEDAIELISRTNPDVVLLDIQMPGCNGIEVAGSLPGGKPRVIFCTAYDQYAIDAFEVEAVDYLLKPVSRARLAAAIDRVRQGSGSDPGIDRVVNAGAPQRFLARHANRFVVIPREQVVYFSSEEGLTQLWTREHSFWMEPTLNDLEARLQGVGFFRISRQGLVNLSCVKEVIPMIGGYGRITLQSGKVLDVSRRRMKELLEQLEGKNQ